LKQLFESFIIGVIHYSYLSKQEGAMPQNVIPLEEKRILGKSAKKKTPLRDMPKIETDSIPAPPDGLNKYALEEWHRLAPCMWEIGTLTTGDVEILASYCLSFAQEKAAQAELDMLSQESRRHGLLAKTTNGNIIQNPLIGIVNTARRDKVRYMMELGLTPAARTRITITEPKDKNAQKGKERFFS
jgi:P27 family predicted phage terminase small subunit